MNGSLNSRLAAEFTGTAFLLAAIIGSGIMGEKLAGGNAAIALLANSIATGAMLFVLIAILGPLSGAHFNPAVTLAMRMDGQIATRDAVSYCVAQVLGAVAGVWLAHAMFDLPVFQISDMPRASPGQWLSEAVAAFGLVLTIFLAVRNRPEFTAAVASLYIVAAYWFTASTSFANPAVTFARAWSDTFAGIAPEHVPAFAGAQFAGAGIALMFFRWLDHGIRKNG